MGPQPGKARCEGEKGRSDPVTKPETRDETRILFILWVCISGSAVPGHSSSSLCPQSHSILGTFQDGKGGKPAADCAAVPRGGWMVQQNDTALEEVKGAGVEG